MASSQRSKSLASSTWNLSRSRGPLPKETFWLARMLMVAKQMLRNTGDFRFGVMSPYDPGLQVVWPWLLPMSWEVRAVLPLRRLQPQARRVYRRLRSRCVLTVCWKCHVSKNKLKRSRDDGQAVVHSLLRKHRGQRTYLMTCLLYTSDAADE